MEIKNIYNNDEGIFKYLKNKFKESSNQYMVLSQIDDQSFELINEEIIKVDKLYLCIDRYLTTIQIFKDLLSNKKYKDVFVYSNSEIQGNKLNNLLIIKQEDMVEIILIPFVITKFNLLNSDSFAISMKGNMKEKYIKETYDLYMNNSGYIKLSEEYINSCDKSKLFRNDKANTIYKDVNKDEIVQSFRNLGDLENYDETLKIIQSQNEARKFSLDKSEISFNLDEEIGDNKKINFNEDIIIDIDI